MYTNIHSDLYYCISWVIAFFFAGALWYVLDRQYYTRIKAWIYDKSHKEPIDLSQVKGAIYRQQKASRKFVWAFIISTIQSALIVWGIAISLFNPLVEFLLWLVEIPVMVLGMFAGKYVYILWSRRSSAFKMIDDIEAGKLHPTEEIADALKEKTEDARKSFSDLLGGLFYTAIVFVEKYWPFSKKDQTTTTTTPEPQKAPEPEVDPRELIKRFKEGK